MPRLPNDVAHLHLNVLGRDRELEIPVRVGPADVLDLLSPARAIASEVAAIAAEDARSKGREVTCRAGCGACCRQVVPISVVEATALAELVSAMPPERRARVQRRFSEAVRRLETTRLIDRRAPRGHRALHSSRSGVEEAWIDVSQRYFAAEIPCPFLEDESCSIHPERPLVCREYDVTTPPERCASLDGGAETTVRPVRMGEVLASVARSLGLTNATMIPLVLALEWADVRGGRLRVPLDGEAMLRALFAEAAAAGDAPAPASATDDLTGSR